MQFRHRFGRHNDVGLVAARKLQLDIEHGEAAPVRGHEGQLVLFKAEEQTVQDIARLIGGDGIRSLAQAIAQILLPHGHHLGVFKFREGREFLFRQPEDLEKALAAPDGGSVLAVHVHLDLTGGQFPHDVEQTPGRQSGGAFLLHLRFKTPAHSDIQVGRGQVDLVPVGLQKHVGKDRKRRPRANDVLDLLQSFEQFFFGNAKFHGQLRAPKM